MALSLLFGAVFVPTERAAAGLFSGLLGDKVYAQSVPTIPKIPQAGSNSQNIVILEANIPPASIFKDKIEPKNAKDVAKDKAEDVILDGADPIIVSENSLLSATGPGGVSDGTEVPDITLQETSVYVVRNGDSISQVAGLFDVTVDTIISFNDLTRGVKLKEGEVLLIPPFSGVEHTVVSGENLQTIANKYKVSIKNIVESNIDLAADSKLAIGEKLIIPGASINSQTKSSTSAGVAKSKSSSVGSSSGYFINPLPTGPRIRKTQGIHDQYAIDVGAPVGTPVYAAASGTVTFAKLGWNGGYGNAVFIKHSNGTETRYAHMSRLDASMGSSVSQGEVIGYVGSTGRSTGPHLHYEVRGAQNNLR